MYKNPIPLVGTY